MPKGPIGDAMRQMVDHIRTYSYMSVWDVARLPNESVQKEREANILAICDELDQISKEVDRTDLRFSDIDNHLKRLSELGTYPLHSDVTQVAQTFFEAKRLDAK